MSTKLTFNTESSEKNHSLTLYDMEESTWPELLETFISFLRGEGYMIDPGEYVCDKEAHGPSSDLDLDLGL